MSDFPNFRIVEQDDATSGAGPVRTEPSPEPRQPVGRSRVLFPLPSGRMRFESQLRALRGWAVAAQNDPTPSNDAVADACRISSTTISGNNAFLVTANLLVKEGGGYRPTDATIEFGRAVSFGAADAPRKLAPALQATWFWKALQPRLDFPPVTREDALLRLAEVAHAGSEHKNQLSVILEWLEAAGLLRREGDQITSVKDAVRPVAIGEIVAEPDPKPVPSLAEQALQASVSATSPGAIAFSVAVNIDMADLLGWEPDRIKELFDGIAKVLSAQSGARS